MTDPNENRELGSVIVVGAGPGIGAAVARTFGRAGHRVGLVARNGARLEQLAAEIGADIGAEVATARADATVPEQVRSAIRSLVGQIGEPDVLCFSPIPDIGLIKPVLDTSSEEFMASLSLGIAGAAAAVDGVVAGMRARGHGSLLFTTGSAALRPDPARAASAVTTTATSVYVSLLRDALAGTGVTVGHTMIVGPVGRDAHDQHDPDDVAADLWAHHAGKQQDFPSVLRLPG